MEFVAVTGVLFLVVGLFVFLLIPAAIWINMYTTLVVCRTLDRRGSLMSGFAWAISKIVSNHWPLLKLGGGEILTLMFGFAFCFVGSLGAVPVTTIQNVATYEWLRLHGSNADNY